MSTISNNFEIVESTESNPQSKIIELIEKHRILKPGQVCSVGDDINKLFEKMDKKYLSKSLGLPDQVSKESLRKRAMKRPMRSCSKIGFSDSVSLKQAFRGLSISQASENAAIKRLSKQIISSRPSNFVSTSNKNLVEISFFPEESTSKLPEEIKLYSDSDLRNKNANVLPKIDEISRFGEKVEFQHVPEESTSKVHEKHKNFPDSDLRNKNANMLQKVDEIARFGEKGESSHVPEESRSKVPEKIKLFSSSNLRNINASTLSEVDEISRVGEKIEFSQSSKNSIGECSNSTSTSAESTLELKSWFRHNRPHMSKGTRWEVIVGFLKQNGCLGLNHFKLIKKIGGGDIGDVYLAELLGTNCLFVLKIMENKFLISKKKLKRAETEREILQMLDHPCLPSLFAYFTTDKFSVLVIEYCPGGDLYTLRKMQPNKVFSEEASRFYVAEVLLALEYLHTLGIVYRDLKPENILIQEDGHIILSDFDLSLKSSFIPTLPETSPLSDSDPSKIKSNHNPKYKCKYPLCFQPSWQIPCFTQKKSSAKSNNKHKADVARSDLFGGTHKYLAPEIVRGEGHGSAVDWWTLGILLYELLYGETPFKGFTNEDTLSNILLNNIVFPISPDVGSCTRDLIGGLLEKDPDNRLGSVGGVGEIKKHPFFEGVNWDLVYCMVPPVLPSGNILKSDLSEENNTELDTF